MIATTPYEVLDPMSGLLDYEAGELVVNHVERGFSDRRIDVDPTKPPREHEATGFQERLSQRHGYFQ